MAPKDRDTLPDMSVACVYGSNALLTDQYRIKPTHYHVSLFDLQLGGSWEYKGIVKIDIQVAEPTKELVLNAKEIQVQNAETLGRNGITELAPQNASGLRRFILC